MTDLPSESTSSDGLELSPEEWQIHFGDQLATSRPDGRRPVGRSVRILGVIVALAMIAGTIAFLVDQIVNRAELAEPADVRSHAAGRVAESPWGFLASDIVVVPIVNPDVGGRVENSPPDGVIQIDRRSWNRDRLDRLVDHELGHLLEFAVWGDRSVGNSAPNVGERRGGLESEAWAECAAVDAGTRRVDGNNADERYHCRSDELETFRTVVAAIVATGELCVPWEATADCHQFP
ncbi:MAG: hypothetical protein ACR2P0_18755 [Acidimicrobiales bacterium]